MEEKFKKAIAARLAMDYQELFSGDLSLGQIIAKSPVCINSIDVLEAFVGSMGDTGIGENISLPTFSTDSSIHEVVRTILELRDGGNHEHHP